MCFAIYLMKIPSEILDENDALSFVQTHWVISWALQNSMLSLLISSIMFKTCKANIRALMQHMGNMKIGVDRAVSKVRYRLILK